MVVPWAPSAPESCPQNRNFPEYLSSMKSRQRPAPMPAPLMLAELAWASWETIARRTFMMAQSTCSPAEYYKMVSEKTAAAMEIGMVLSSPMGASAAPHLKPLHSRATPKANPLRR